MGKVWSIWYKLMKKRSFRLCPCRISGKLHSLGLKELQGPFSVFSPLALWFPKNCWEPGFPEKGRNQGDAGSWEWLQLLGTGSVKQWIEEEMWKEEKQMENAFFGKWLNSCVAQVWKMVYRTSIWRTKYRKEMRLMFWKPAADDVMCSGHSVLCSCIIPLVSRHLTGRWLTESLCCSLLLN